MVLRGSAFPPDRPAARATRPWCRVGGWLAGWLGLFLAACPAAANPQADSLLALLRRETQDTSRVLLYMELGYANRADRPDLALHYAQTGLRLARRIGYRYGEAKCLNTQGGAYLALGNLPKALESLLGALHLHEALGNRHGVAAALGNIGRVYDSQGDRRSALRYGFRALAQFEAIHNDVQATLQLLNIGGSYLELGPRDSALYYTRAGYRRAQRLRDDRSLVIALVNLGELYRDHDFRQALRFYRQAVAPAHRINHTEHLCTIYFNMAEVWGEHGRPDSLLHYGRRSLALARASGINDAILDASRVLTRYYDQHHRPDSAYRYLKLAVAARDSVYSQENLQRVQQMTFAENLRQQEQRAVQEQARRQRRYNLQLVGVAAFIFAFLAVLVPLGRRVPPRALNALGFVSLLMLFEFITLLAEPTVQRLTNNSPALLLVIMVTLAAALSPLHHRLERWIKQRLTLRALADGREAAGRQREPAAADNHRQK